MRRAQLPIWQNSLCLDHPHRINAKSLVRRCKWILQYLQTIVKFVNTKELKGELKPCVQYEHHSIGDIERFNRTLEDGIVKL